MWFVRVVKVLSLLVCGLFIVVVVLSLVLAAVATGVGIGDGMQTVEIGKTVTAEASASYLYPTHVMETAIASELNVQRDVERAVQRMNMQATANVLARQTLTAQPSRTPTGR